MMSTGPAGTLPTARASSFRTAAASVKAVARVSAPANALSETSTASSTPSEMASRSASAACGGPMVSTVTVPPCFSRMRIPSSIA